MVRQNNETEAAVRHWLTAFETALTRREAKAAAGLFLPDGQWRDILAFTWAIESVLGRAGIEARLRNTLETTRPLRFCVDPQRTAPRWVIARERNASKHLLCSRPPLAVGTACYA